MRIGLIADTHDRLLFINPGECCGWITGRCSIAVLDLARNEVEPLEVSP